MTRCTKLMVFLLSLILLVSTFSAIVSADGTTEVTFRMVYYSPGGFASTTLYIYRYSSLDATEPYDRIKAGILRSDNQQWIFQLEPGFYSAKAYPEGGWEYSLSGSTDIFEVRGDKMTVYVPVESEEYPAPRPDQWLVYGEDNQNFYIWASEEPSEPESSENETSHISGESLPDIDTSVEIIETTSIVPTPSREESIAHDSSEEEKTSVKVGNYIFSGIVIILLLASIIALYVIRKKRGQ